MRVHYLTIALLAGCGSASAPQTDEEATSGAEDDEPEVADTDAGGERVQSWQADLDRLTTGFADASDDFAEAMASERCADAVEIGDRICELAERICEIADAHMEDEGTRARCEDGRARCERARAQLDEC